jgi:uncharacterized damage-inducible protein DinB
MKWFDRKFNFDTVNGTMDGILERLRYTPIRLRHKCTKIPENMLIQKTGSSWSIQEHAGHLSDLEPLWLGRVEDMINGVEIMRPADLENLKTHEANHNDLPLNQILENFQEERRRLMIKMEENRDRAETLMALHPRLDKPMRLIDLAYFVAEHDDHHLAAISSLQNSLFHGK